MADELVIVVDASRQHDWRLTAVDKRRREAWALLHVTIKEDTSPIVALAKGERCGCLGFALRRARSLRGPWRAYSTPQRTKRTARRRKVQEICRRSPSPPVDRVLQGMPPILRGGGTSCALGAARRGFGSVRDGVEKQGRRHRRRARHRRGVGWKRGRRRGLYDSLGRCNHSRVQRRQQLRVKALPA